MIYPSPKSFHLALRNNFLIYKFNTIPIKIPTFLEVDFNVHIDK